MTGTSHTCWPNYTCRSAGDHDSFQSQVPLANDRIIIFVGFTEKTTGQGQSRGCIGSRLDSRYAGSAYRYLLFTFRKNEGPPSRLVSSGERIDQLTIPTHNTHGLARPPPPPSPRTRTNQPLLSEGPDVNKAALSRDDPRRNLQTLINSAPDRDAELHYSANALKGGDLAGWKVNKRRGDDTSTSASAGAGN